MNIYILIKEVGESMAMTNRLSFVDVDTLDVLKIPTGVVPVGEDQWAGVKENINNDPGRFLEIPVSNSKEAYELRVTFLEHVTEEDQKAKLKVALEGLKPFRAFRETLLEYPVLREKWFDFHNRNFLYKAAEWLATEGVLATKVGRSEVK